METEKILIVDDERSSIAILEDVLNSSNIATEVVTDGLQAVGKVLSQKYKLVVLDWNMPTWGGQKTLLLADLLAQSDLMKTESSTPFVLYTATDPLAIDLPHTKCFHMVDFWDKLAKVNVLTKKANNLLSRLKEVQ